ncbi:MULTISPECIES: xanthine phosphoribosyltransferase [Aneurinibacillus]|uniref:Xanthine phosphoribosyltransferase n=1 Tax=Aneurinibacillus thermoaerophilus TaxID=143495 RepID=A0A1G8DAP9_ANETH|nr:MULTISPECIES: xanthine phosphoribosyltransferase [Aneurinibacillus]AMA72002.1 xanthine phosphoribosyltransferase [Aneurinibacillus sp. XH2]MED0677037.1 xanthine phosphoribosyltransferase [Aneurinibacillus thermoaerophilus]MED0679283.1 xanthine phosphoribosyltransferase [Aneurinibacillus thermoaerophilus]MED0737169.1 xanthine phosphoribosyltransferase [Aneurinibacillus thermoaerophilus]MED0757215.1 xanthine phosphoribosyltransferase [Aneurinibacillus thermoaerophilus]
MELLKEKIRQEGHVLNDKVLKVDSFLNHQIDPELMMAIGEEFARRFADTGVTKVLTIESSGIAAALTAALKLNVKVVFARKKKSALMNEEAYVTQVHSFTKNETNEVTVLKKFLGAGEKILIIDDFLANGEAAMGLARIVEQAGSEVVGIGIVIEKAFQDGGKRLRESGFRVESLARIATFAGGEVQFAEECVKHQS